jgi:PAS domain S-box-containing protein
VPDTSDIPAQNGSAPRLAAFYRALSAMNQAIAHVSDPMALYNRLCGIAVATCGARMAWIGLIGDGRVQPLAWAGEAAAYTRGLVIAQPRAGESDADLGPTAYALHSGQACICNDFHAEPRTVRFREWAARFGVKASGAFPIRRAGQVVGTLNLYFDAVGAFDAALVELVEQLVLDLCFALEHIDREAARALAERTARERELQLSAIVQSAMDAIISIDAQFNVVLFNDAAARMFGVPAAEAIGRPLDRFLPPEVAPLHRVHLADYARRGISTRRMGNTALELSGVRASGERFPMEASISITGSGDRLLMTVMARDVTQLRLTEKAQLARMAAEAANQAKTEFLSRISHELRTPLNAMLGFAQLLRDEGRDTLGERQREQLDLVLQAGAHLRVLVDEMLDISRIEAGRIDVEHRDFELCELLDGVLRMSRPHAEEFGVTLEPGFAAHGRLLMRTDPDRLRQVLMNLVSNAIKYNRLGGWVRLEVETDRHFVHILVRDNGLGMSEAQKAQLFQPFNRLGREQSGVQGTGIGLVLVRQLAGLLGAEITLDSREGEGTVVRLTLPATDGRPMAPQAPRDSAPAPEPPAAVVLYIEDNPINVILVQQLLSRWPQVQLVTAGDGAQGLERARVLRPDAVLLDMQLPDMHGVTVLQRLKADEATRDIVVVALSASAIPADVAAARAAGAADYWTKPIDFDSFIAGMRCLLARGAQLEPPPAPGAPTDS